MNTRLIGLHFGLIKQAGPVAQLIGRQLGKKPVIKALETSADKVMRLTGKGAGKVTAEAEKAVPTALQAAERRIAGQATKAPVSTVAPNVAEVERAFANMQRAGITPPNAAGMREFVGAPGSRALVPYAGNAAASGSRALVPYAEGAAARTVPLELMPSAGSKSLALPGAIPRNPRAIDVASEMVGQGVAKSRFPLSRLLTTLGLGAAGVGGYNMYKFLSQPGAGGVPAPAVPAVPAPVAPAVSAAPTAAPVAGAPQSINQQAAPVTAATAATAAKRNFDPFKLTDAQYKRFRRETGTKFNPYSVADVNYFLNRFGDGATMSEAQADADERARARGTAAQNADRLRQLTGQA